MNVIASGSNMAPFSKGLPCAGHCDTLYLFLSQPCDMYSYFTDEETEARKLRN